VATAAWQAVVLARVRRASRVVPWRRGAARARHPVREARAAGDCARGLGAARAQVDREPGRVSVRVSLTHSSDAKYFARPLALSRLARFLVDARRTKKTGRQEPGAAGAGRGQRQLSDCGRGGAAAAMCRARLAITFGAPAERARAQVKWHGWEASVVQVSRGEVERWEERMVEQMNS
jgi:hypothetical protein